MREDEERSEGWKMGVGGRQEELKKSKKILLFIKNVVKSIFIRKFVSSKMPHSDEEKWTFCACKILKIKK